MFDITFTTGDCDFIRADMSVGIEDSYFILLHGIAEGDDWFVDVYEIIPEYTAPEIEVEYGVKTDKGWKYGGQVV